MKLTLEIPQEHTGQVLAMLATLMKPSTVEAQPDPAEGHPELPLMPVEMSVEEWVASRLPTLDDESEEIAETRWAVAGIDAADPLKVEMEPCEAELPFPEDFPELPPLPEGKTRWVYRGTFPEKEPNTETMHKNRCIKYRSCFGDWHDTETFDGLMPHIEAL